MSRTFLTVHQRRNLVDFVLIGRAGAVPTHLRADRPDAPHEELPEGLLPEGKALQYSALVHTTVGDLRKMLKQVDMPPTGEKHELAIRIIRELSGLPPTAEDAVLIEEYKAWLRLGVASGQVSENSPNLRPEASLARRSNSAPPEVVSVFSAGHKY